MVITNYQIWVPEYFVKLNWSSFYSEYPQLSTQAEGKNGTKRKQSSGQAGASRGLTRVHSGWPTAGSALAYILAVPLQRRPLWKQVLPGPRAGPGPLQRMPSRREAGKAGGGPA